MLNPQLKATYRLSTLIVVLMLAQAGGGLLIDDLYRDNLFVTTASRGNDLVTLMVATPLLGMAIVLSRRGSARAQLVWLGMLDYALYNYAFYLFGTAFNKFFLLYVALFALSIYALLIGLANLEVGALRQQFVAGTPVRWISGYMLFVALGLTCVYLAQSFGFILTGQLPPIVTLSGHPTNIVFALDLSLVVPVLVLGAVLLWRRHPWGYVLATIANVKGAVYMLVLCVNTVWAFQVGAIQDLAEVGLWATIGVGSLMAAVALLHHLRAAAMPASQSQARLGAVS